MSDYIDPATATQVRIFPVGFGEWQVDAADDHGGYTEACWSHRPVMGEHGEKWVPITSVKDAMVVVPLFIAETVPHLAGTEPVVRDS